MSHPYREMKYIEREPDLVLPDLCTCGHTPEDHFHFNGDLVYCKGAGTYDRTPVARIVNPSPEDVKRGFVKHQVKGVCDCQRYRDWHPPLALLDLRRLY